MDTRDRTMHQPTPPTSLPSGTVTFLFMEIEGSTERRDRQPDAMQPALQRHDALLRKALAAEGGHVYKTVGDAICAAFATAGEGLAPTIAARRAVAGEPAFHRRRHPPHRGNPHRYWRIGPFGPILSCAYE